MCYVGIEYGGYVTVIVDGIVTDKFKNGYL